VILTFQERGNHYRTDTTRKIMSINRRYLTLLFLIMFGNKNVLDTVRLEFPFKYDGANKKFELEVAISSSD